MKILITLQDKDLFVFTCESILLNTPYEYAMKVVVVTRIFIHVKGFSSFPRLEICNQDVQLQVYFAGDFQ